MGEVTVDRRKFVALGLVASLSLRSRGASAEPDANSKAALVYDDVDWPSFLARHDLVWDMMPRRWADSPFLGNGKLALSLRGADGDHGGLRFTIDNTDVYDRRDPSWGWTAYSRARYHPGDFVLTPAGRITAIQMRLGLWNGELEGSVTTSAGVISFVAFVHPTRMTIVIDLDVSAGERACRWHWEPGQARSSRKPVETPADAAEYQKAYGHDARIWRDNPPPRFKQRGETASCAQDLLAGGGYATAWLEIKAGQTRRTLYVSCMMSWPRGDAEAKAIAEVRWSSAAGHAALRTQNRAWWHAFYPASFVSIPDPQLESFYWIQLYKYGCAAPKEAGIIDTHGPWLQPTNWPYITWNLNSQIACWALQPTNHLELADSLFRQVDRWKSNLRRNAGTFGKGKDVAVLGHCSQQDLDGPLEMDVRFEREWGNLLWICHNYWLQYRFTMDDVMLRDRLLPLLRSAVNFYLPYLEERSDNRLHLPATFSPEIGLTTDCNYDLALLRWGCSALVSACERLRVHDRQAAQWKDIVARLTDFPVDEHGLRVGADLPAAPHRHFSHLLMIYPLYLMTWDDPKARTLIKRSVERWYAATRGEKSDAGFTLAVGASFYASMQRGDDALTCLKSLLQASAGMGQIMPNTMYAESGQNIETPLAAAQSVLDILLQSWGGMLRIFPAMPRSWRDAVFHNLRAQGGFVVSARLVEGRLAWVRIKSLAGEPCRFQAAFDIQPQSYTAAGRLAVTTEAPGRYMVDLKKGDEALVTAGNAVAHVSPVGYDPALSNYYGLRA